MGIAAQWVHGARLCVIPHPDNNYHPLALRHRPLVFVSALLIAVKILTIGVLALTPSTAELSTITTNRIVQLTNNERVKAGLQPLTISDKLTRAAQMKAQDMLDNQYFAHISPTGVTPWFWMNKVGYTYQVAGENLAIDFTEAEDVVAAWIASPTHKENMLLPDYVETGVAVVTGEFQGSTSTIVVHEFGKPNAANATVQASVKNTYSTPSPAVKSAITPREYDTPTSTPTSTPTPSPSTSATPTTEVPAQGETPAPGTPRTPRIALLKATDDSGQELNLHIEGDSQALVHFLVNNKESVTAPTNDEGTLDYTMKINDIPDGAITIRAYSTNQKKKQSALSDALAIVKQTPLQQQPIAFILAPDTDNPRALITAVDNSVASADITSGDKKTTLSMNEVNILPLTLGTVKIAAKTSTNTKIAPYEITLTPQFNQEKDLAYITPSASLSKASRMLIATIAIIILALLSIAIFVRIRVQRPALIAHTSAVALLAFLLLFV